MSDKIGDYIHWKYDNYLHYSLNYASTEKFTGAREHPFPQQIFQQQRTRILEESQSINRQIIDQKETIRTRLLHELNYLWEDPSGIFLQNEQETLTNQEVLQMMLQAVKDARFNNIDFNFTANLGVENFQSGNIESRFKDLATSGDILFIKSIMERIKAIRKYRSELRQDAEQASDWQEWLRRTEELDKEWGYIQRQLNDWTPRGIKTGLQQMESKSIKTKQKIVAKEKSELSTAELKQRVNSFIIELNELIALGRRKSRRYLLGQIGEISPILFRELLQKKGQFTSATMLYDFMKDLASNPNQKGNGLTIWEGWESSEAWLDPSKFTVQGTTMRTNSLIPGLMDDRIEVTTTQDKVDLTFNMENLSLPASIKNVNFINNYNIHILSGKSILYYLQDYGLFLNHYLNITASHSPHDYQRPNINLISLANRTLIFSLGLKALAGGVLKVKDGIQGKSKEAGIFVINDNSGVTGHYRVYFIDDLINLFYNNFNRLSQFLQMENFYEATTWKQSFEGDMAVLNYNKAYARILKLLVQLQQQKIDMSIPKSVFMNI